ncbi:MAG: phage tail sheath subtilisin-like domain-containing protein [Candidatus Manganitrophaceae bacterium]
MPQYLSPGVYVEEVPSAIKAIAGVSTSTPGFIGTVPDKIHQIAKDPAGAPGATKFVDFTLPTPAKTVKLITNWTQFTQAFGDLIGNETAAKTTDASPAVDEGHRRLAHAVYGFFNNGGSRCYVVRIKDDTELDDALNAFAAIDEIALVAAPGETDDATRDKLVTHCQTTADRFAILDGPETEADLTKLTKTAAESGLAPKKTDFAAWYFPWIKVFDPATKLAAPNGDGLLAVPPAGHLAGIYARVDTERGVHKAPANEAVRGALNVTQPLSKADQDGLNPKGVNCIRVLNDSILAWGARTVGGDANADLKYINVRRTLLFLRESIDEGTQWVVFEPNTPALWQKITRNVSAFLTNVWRSGALFGNTPEEAFYVKCDAETNPPELRELGQVVTEIGVAIVRPAEFVIFRISQWQGPSKG